MSSWLDEEKQLFLLSSLPPLIFAGWLFLLLQRSPKPIIESIATFIPGLQPPKFSNGMACLRLEASADIIQHMNKLLKEHNDMVSSNLHVTGMEPRHLRDGLSRFAHHLAELPNTVRASASGESGGSASQRRGGQSAPVVESAEVNEDSEQEASSQPEVSRVKTDVDVGVGGREVWVNPKHLSRLFLLPNIFVAMYFMDAAVISREASVDFPLDNCMGDSKCFYNLQDYSLWKYPTYTKLDCEGMQQRTVESEDGFFFMSPRGARFYKCYTWVFSTQNIIQAVGDVVALLAVCTLVILYFCVDVSSAKMGAEVAEDVEDTVSAASVKALLLRKLKCERRWRWLKQLLFVALGIASIALVPRLYGKKTNDFEAYLGIPGVCFFAVILLSCRNELLGTRIAELQDELRGDDSESGGSSSSSEDLAPDVRSSSMRSLPATQASDRSGYNSVHTAERGDPPAQRVLLQV